MAVCRLRSADAGPAAPTSPAMGGRERPYRKSSLVTESPGLDAPRWLRKRGVESPQEEGGSPWRSTRPTLLPRSGPSRSWTGWATRSPSCRRISRPLIRPPPGSDPRVRRPGRLEQRVPLLRRLAELARGARPGGGPGEGPGGARPGDAAGPGPGSCPRGAVVRQGAGADPRGHAGDGSAAAGSGAGRASVSDVERIV